MESLTLFFSSRYHRVMGRNLHCGCLCHGSNGNRIGDEYFSCKNCYAANHMDSLPRKVVVTKAAPKRKPLKKPVDPLTTLVKGAAKKIMNDIADAAGQVKREWV